MYLHNMVFVTDHHNVRKSSLSNDSVPIANLGYDEERRFLMVDYKYSSWVTTTQEQAITAKIWCITRIRDVRSGSHFYGCG